MFPVVPATPAELLAWNVLVEANKLGISRNDMTDAVITALLDWQPDNRRAVAESMRRCVEQVAESDSAFTERDPAWEVLIRYDTDRAAARSMSRKETVRRLNQLVRDVPPFGQAKSND